MSRSSGASTHTIFGIRHHGPGSARALRRALETLEPDTVLVEGPPDAGDLIHWAADPEMEPPVALLLYRPDEPHSGVYYPFAHFSPEWQAIRYALAKGIPVRFFDLAQGHQMALALDQAEVGDEETETTVEVSEEELAPLDPFGWVARASGYDDGERWWEEQVEQRQEDSGLFLSILELMSALRSELESSSSPRSPTVHQQREELREAAMRQTIRRARKEGAARIAVVCGAWHAPALVNLDNAKADASLLRKLPRVKVSATWVPWTNGRLSRRSGYGAGIDSPGWYEHLWDASGADLSSDQITTAWLIRVARLFREEDLTISPGHVIEGVRLASTLAALRQRSLPGLAELNEAAEAIFTFGDPAPMGLIHERLIAGERMGTVASQVPTLPIQADLTRLQKRLRLRPEASDRELDLDLRKPNGRERSRLLHRLLLLDVPWGEERKVQRALGTFHELWHIQWRPELSLALIEASLWGNTIEAAAASRALDLARKAEELATITPLVQRLLLADLPDALDGVLAELQRLAALADDVEGLMRALPPLVRALRYGDVRETDISMLSDVIDGMVVRICVGLPRATSSLDRDAAAAMLDRIVATNTSLQLLLNEEHLTAWREVLRKLVDREDLHGLLAGRICRLLLEQRVFGSEEVARRMGLALSVAVEPAESALWIEGFLTGSGALLIHDPLLWQILDHWVNGLDGEQFMLQLPLLRRTFSTFTRPERRQMGERVAGAGSNRANPEKPTALDHERSESLLPLLAQLLGMANGEEPTRNV